jgi:hypothetical protein
MKDDRAGVRIARQSGIACDWHDRSSAASGSRLSLRYSETVRDVLQKELEGLVKVAAPLLGKLKSADWKSAGSLKAYPKAGRAGP